VERLNSRNGDEEGHFFVEIVFKPHLTLSDGPYKAS
jgi:hypothetical protein